MHVDLNTVLGTMAITAIILALPKPGSPLTWGSVYKFFYDAVTGFWSLKTGSKPADPTVPVANPAPTQK